jgi:hypothetical protein
MATEDHRATLNFCSIRLQLQELDEHFSSYRSLLVADPPMRTTLVPSEVGTIAAPSVALGRFGPANTIAMFTKLYKCTAVGRSRDVSFSYYAKSHYQS